MASNNSIGDTVYQVLREGIMSLKLSPGTSMSTQEMASRLNVSRTPIREAFLKLQKEGLLDVAPQKGTTVSLIDAAQAEQERFLRESLELAIAEPLIQCCTSEHIAKLNALIIKQQAAFTAGDSVSFIQLDNSFHQIFFTAAGQQLSWNVVMNNNAHYNRLRLLSINEPDTFQAAIQQHRLILSFIEKKNVEGLKKELSSHVRKINAEKTDLLEKYPDYFASEQKPLSVNLL